MRKRIVFMSLILCLVVFCGCNKIAPNTESSMAEGSRQPPDINLSSESSEYISSSSSISSEYEKPAGSNFESSNYLDTRSNGKVASQLPGSSLNPNRPTGDNGTESSDAKPSRPEPQPVEPERPVNPSKPSESKPSTSTPDSSGSESQKPEFDISYWVSYAVSYAKRIGLNLNKEAVSSWDNPITANANSRYLERDIKNRLDRYGRDKEITDVWIWTEKNSDGSYDLFIGYA